MIILGIETSCDETAVALVENGTKILSNILASSIEFHKKTGGIIPEVAAREQVRCIIPVIQEALTSKVFNLKSKVDVIAITVGPGLIGSLLVGVETAKALSLVWQKPIVPINHLQAHLYANFICEPPITNNQLPKFPAIGLVVSGGHTDLVLMKNHGKIKWLGGTRDDAAGECFDKCARFLGLGYPGGPAIAAAADSFSSNQSLLIKLPRPMINDNNFDFSFSGLKTALHRFIPHGKLNTKLVSTLAYEVQEAITDVLVKKTFQAAKKYKVKSILLAGGVAANSRLREKFKLAISHQPSIINLFIPSPSLCTDNATFIASCAYFNYQPVSWQRVQADYSLGIEEMIKS